MTVEGSKLTDFSKEELTFKTAFSQPSMNI